MATDQAPRDFGGAVVEALGLGAGLVEVAGEFRPFGEQLLGIGLDAGMGAHAAIEAADAGIKPLERPVEPLRQRLRKCLRCRVMAPAANHSSVILV